MLRVILSAIAFLLLQPCSWGESESHALARAGAAIENATWRAEVDPARPIFHVAAPAQWINDPNGPIFHKGLYHLFYQLHPFSDGNGPKFWGHVRSRNLAKWEQLPVALAPSEDSGETGVWSGCCVINGQGTPMIFYTSVGRGKSAMEHAEQWVATSDDDLIHWKKSDANPVLSDALHGDTKIHDWRDPFIFRHGRRTFMVLGGSLNRSQGGQAVVTIYEAEDPALMKWKYRGVMFQHPDPDARTAECPNFFKLGDQWVLLVSPYGKVQYFVGNFDAATCRFKARTRGLLDESSSFYAPNTMLVPDGRRIVWGWVKGFPGGRGWNGCLSLPRLLSLSPDGHLRQEPAPQLSKLRGERAGWRNVRLEDGGKTFSLPKTNTLEIRAEIDLQSATGVALRFQSGDTNATPVVVRFNGLELQVADVSAPLSIAADQKRLSLRIFLDRSVLEVFVNETACVTKVIPPLDANSTLEIQPDGGTAKARRIQAWPMNSIW